MKYPDINLIRFVNKTEIVNMPKGRVIEFGCGSGHNLRIFEDLGWQCLGVDLAGNLEFRNEALGGKWKTPHQFFELDLNSELPMILLEQNFDVILFPNITYYLHPDSRLRLFYQMSKCLNPGGYVFLIERLVDDFRFGKGIQLSRNRFQLKIADTGELDQIIQFFEINEIVRDLYLSFGLERKDVTLLEQKFDNLQNSIIVRNSELIVWGHRS